jgi:hypothetical protein
MESPVVKSKPRYMTFSDAMREVVIGKRVTREEWGNDNEYAELKDGILTLHTSTDNFKQGYWGVRDVDMIATDWLVVEPMN